MKVLITGASGMLGLELCRTAVKQFGRGNVVGLTHYDMDITDEALVNATLDRHKPEVVINAAGLVKSRQSTDKAFEWVNGHGPWTLAAKCDLRGIRMVQISTDCVFAGDGPHVETDTPNATDIYGQSKAKGEIPWGKHLNLRMSFIGLGKRGLLAWLMSQRETVKGYTEARWNGLTTQYAARRILESLETPDRVQHIFGQDCTKYDILVAANEIFGLGLKIQPDESVRSDMRLRSIYPQPEMPPIQEQLAELARTRWTPIKC